MDVAYKETVLQLLNPLEEYSFYRHLRRNFRARYIQEKEKQCLVWEKNIQCTGHQDNASINQKVDALVRDFLFNFVRNCLK